MRNQCVAVRGGNVCSLAEKIMISFYDCLVKCQTGDGLMGKNSEVAWEEARKRCKMSKEAIGMAKELGIMPKSLIKLIPNQKAQPWKSSVEDFVRYKYEAMKLRRERRAKLKVANWGPESE
jgi:hypothetical protein